LMSLEQTASFRQACKRRATDAKANTWFKSSISIYPTMHTYLTFH